MNAQQLREAGYKVSLQLADTEVARAEALVIENYITPITHDDDTTDDVVKKAVMQLVFIALCGDNTHATRAGGKVKLSPQLSERGYVSQADYDIADKLLRDCQTLTGAEQGNVDKIVNDVLHIYFRSYLGM